MIYKKLVGLSKLEGAIGRASSQLATDLNEVVISALRAESSTNEVHFTMIFVY